VGSRNGWRLRVDNANQGIDAFHQSWTPAIRRGDVDAALELLTPDYVLQASSCPALTGLEAVRALFNSNHGRLRDRFAIRL
jgi:ketosteroid isomerase-like protein